MTLYYLKTEQLKGKLNRIDYFKNKLILHATADKW